MLKNFVLSFFLIPATKYKVRKRICINTKRIIRKLNSKKVRLKNYYKRRLLVLFRKLWVRKIEVLFGYSYLEIQNSLAVSSFLLVILKINFYIFFHCKIFVSINVILLFFFYFLSLKIKLPEKIRRFIYRFLMSNLGEWYLSWFDETWEQLKNDPEMTFLWITDENEKIIGSKPFEIPKDRIWHKFVRNCCYFLIFIRLFVYSEPIIYIILRWLIAYFLIFNQLLVVTYIISFCFIFSRFLILVIDKEYSTFKLGMSLIEEDLDNAEMTIKPSWQTSKLILCWLTKVIKNDKKLQFYQTKQDILSFHQSLRWYLDTRLENIGFPVVWRDVYYPEKKYFEVYPRNKYMYYFLFFVILFLLVLYNIMSSVGTIK